ncbi:potassium channel subfamily K member 13-like [Cherax quadricarinatus]|uniref:potassium channel subfamily K member 13-like n=1 Tax=Cherax quadricarinatus TaxID=27406 RepID=UPI00387E85C7
MENHRSHNQLVKLERMWDAYSSGSVIEDLRRREPSLTPTHRNKPVYSTDRWASLPAAKTTHRRPNSSDDSDSHSDSFGSSTGTSVSEGSNSIGCCSCLYHTSRRSSAERRKNNGAVLSAMPHHRKRWWHCLSMADDTAIFFLLGIFTLTYMLLGSLIFQVLEQDYEKHQRTDLQNTYNKMRNNMTDSVNKKTVELTEVYDLLYAWGNMSAALYAPSDRELWDFFGSFYFVFEGIFTLGYGVPSLKTVEGKVFSIFFSLIGCSSSLLFYNLFLERIITILAKINRAHHDWKEQRKAKAAAKKDAVVKIKRRETDSNDEEDDDDDEELDTYKPSLYWDMFYLIIFSIILIVLGAVLYMKEENWSYFESVYFCYISFSTIGFGDYIAIQEVDSFYGESVLAYKVVNFLVLLLGCCCIYSLFNVISLIIKKHLNYIVDTIQACFPDEPHSNVHVTSKNVLPAAVQKTRSNNIVGDGGSFRDGY